MLSWGRIYLVNREGALSGISFEQAEDLAAALTEMSTTGEDFLAGEIDGEIIISRYDGEGLEADMTPEEAIHYATIFAYNGAKKCRMAVEFLRQHDKLSSNLLFVRPPLRCVLEIIEERVNEPPREAT